MGAQERPASPPWPKPAIGVRSAFGSKANIEAGQLIGPQCATFRLFILLDQAARQLPDLSTTICVETSSTVDPHLCR